MWGDGRQPRVEHPTCSANGEQRSDRAVAAGRARDHHPCSGRLPQSKEPGSATANKPARTSWVGLVRQNERREPRPQARGSVHRYARQLQNRRQNPTRSAVTRHIEPVPGASTGHEQQTTLCQEVYLMLEAIDVGWSHRLRERSSSVVHPNDSDASELQALERMHRADADDVRRTWVIPRKRTAGMPAAVRDLPRPRRRALRRVAPHGRARCARRPG